MNEGLLLEVLDQRTGKIRNIPLSSLTTQATMSSVQETGTKITDEDIVEVGSGVYYIDNTNLNIPTQVILTSGSIGHLEIGVNVTNQVVILETQLSISMDYFLNVNGATVYGTVSQPGPIYSTDEICDGALMSLYIVPTDTGLLMVGKIDYDPVIYIPPPTDIVDTPVYVLTQNPLIKTEYLGPIVLDNRNLQQPTYVIFSYTLFSQEPLPIKMTVLTDSQPIIVVNGTGEEIDVCISSGDTTYKATVGQGQIIPGISNTTGVSSIYMDISIYSIVDTTLDDFVQNVRMQGSAIQAPVIDSTVEDIDTTFTDQSPIYLSQVYDGNVITVNNSIPTVLYLDPSLNAPTSLTNIVVTLNLGGNLLSVQNGLTVPAALTLLIASNTESSRQYYVILPGQIQEIGYPPQGSSLSANFEAGGIAGLLSDGILSLYAGAPIQCIMDSDYTITPSNDGDHLVISNPEEFVRVNLHTGPELVNNTTSLQIEVSAVGQPLLLSNDTGVPLRVRLLPLISAVLDASGPRSAIVLPNLQNLTSTVTISGNSAMMNFQGSILQQTYPIYKGSVISPTLSDLELGVNVDNNGADSITVVLPPVTDPIVLLNVYTYNFDATINITNGVGRDLLATIADSTGRLSSMSFPSGNTLKLPSGSDVIMSISGSNINIQVYP